MKFGLPEKTIRSIQSVLAQFPDVEEALVYGSQAKGNYKLGSDIDITLVGEDLTIRLLRVIDRRLQNLELPYEIDISVRHLIGDPAVVEHVNRVGKLFYKKGADSLFEN